MNKPGTSSENSQYLQGMAHIHVNRYLSPFLAAFTHIHLYMHKEESMCVLDSKETEKIFKSTEIFKKLEELLLKSILTAFQCNKQEEGKIVTRFLSTWSSAGQWIVTATVSFFLSYVNKWKLVHSIYTKTNFCSPSQSNAENTLNMILHTYQLFGATVC